MLSPPDLIVIGAAALLFFGPDQLPKVARRAGQVVREVQNTSQAFIREIERAADEPAPPVSRHDWAADAVDRSVPGGPDRAPGVAASIARLVEPTYTPSGPIYPPHAGVELPAEARASADAETAAIRSPGSAVELPGIGEPVPEQVPLGIDDPDAAARSAARAERLRGAVPRED